jgi:MerR HTH family regulatory protein
MRFIDEPPRRLGCRVCTAASSCRLRPVNRAPTTLRSPASVGGNGYRYYGHQELLRLQQILVLRELGLGLADVGGILRAQTPTIAALRAHHARLLAERSGRRARPPTSSAASASSRR